MIISVLSCLCNAAVTLFEEVNLRNDSIGNSLVLAPWRAVSFEIQPQGRKPTGQMVLLSVPVSHSSASLGECCHALVDPKMGS